MAKKVITEGKRTFYATCIYTAFLLFIDDDLVDKGTAVSLHIPGIKRVLAILNYYLVYLFCHVFVPYIGFAVVAIQYYSFMKACFRWIIPRPERYMERGIFGEFDGCSYQEAKDLVSKLRKRRLRSLKKYIFSQCTTCWTPKDIVYLRTIKPESLNEMETAHRPCFTHPNIAPLYRIYDPRGRFYFATRYDDVNLSLVLFNEKFSQDKDFFKFAMKWTTDIVHGVQYLHNMNVYHLNLQPENISVEFETKDLVPLESKAVIGNFKHMQKPTEGKLVSAQGIVLPDCYRPPEAHITSLDRSVDAEKCDIWGIGIITLELLTGGMLLVQSTGSRFSFNQRNDTLARMQESTFFCAAIEAAHGGGCIDLLQNMGQKENVTSGDSQDIDETALWIWWVFVTDLLKFDPNIRIGINSACQHGFMQKSTDILGIQSDENEGETKQESDVEFFKKIDRAIFTHIHR